jgi:hypothetical protein
MEFQKSSQMTMHSNLVLDMGVDVGESNKRVGEIESYDCLYYLIAS